MVLVYLWCKCCIDMVGGKSAREEEVEATTDIVKWKLLTERCYLQMDQNSMSPFKRMSSYFRNRSGWVYVNEEEVTI